MRTPFAYITLTAFMAVFSLTGPAAAETLAAEEGAPVAAAEPSTAGWEVVHRGTIDKVTVRHTDSDGNVHEGCHNRQTQTSEPGAC